MRKHLIYDMPTRIFHVLFAGLFLVAFTIGKTIDDDSLIFSYHMLAGILLSALVFWRIIWGIIGSDYARFSNFNLNPRDLLSYFKGILSGSKKRWSGHNPASSWAALTMFALGLGLGITGYLMSTGAKETFEEVHEILANTFILVVISHVAGVILHTLRHKDLIALSMFDGHKNLESEEKSIPSQRVFAGILLLAMVGGLATYLFKNFDSQTRNLTVAGQTLQLGESEQGEQGQKRSEKEGHEDYEHDSDDFE